MSTDFFHHITNKEFPKIGTLHAFVVERKLVQNNNIVFKSFNIGQSTKIMSVWLKIFIEISYKLSPRSTIPM
jgi:hypothetical protein